MADLKDRVREIVEVNHFFSKPNHVDLHLSRAEFMALHVETLTCMTLSILYDSQSSNHFDCPWDWRNAPNRSQSLPIAPK